MTEKKNLQRALTRVPFPHNLYHSVLLIYPRSHELSLREISDPHVRTKNVLTKSGFVVEDDLLIQDQFKHSYFLVDTERKPIKMKDSPEIHLSSTPQELESLCRAAVKSFPLGEVLVMLRKFNPHLQTDSEKQPVKQLWRSYLLRQRE